MGIPASYIGSKWRLRLREDDIYARMVAKNPLLKTLVDLLDLHIETTGERPVGAEKPRKHVGMVMWPK